VSLLDRPTVKRVSDALLKAGLGDRIIELDSTASSAEDAAKAVGCDLGAIVKSLVFTVDNRFVMALVAGDHKCLEQNLPRALNLVGPVRRPDASAVKGVTGFSIGGVAPIGLAHPLPTVIDRSLKRFETVYAAAGHPHCVFAASPAELARLTSAIISLNVAQPIGADAPAPMRRRRSKTFLAANSSTSDESKA